METIGGTKTKNGAGLLIFLGWLLYMTSYLGKVNYSANITQIMDFYNITKSEAGTVPTFFFCSYGIGQVINGVLCKRYNMKWIIFVSMMTSAIINFIIAVSTSFPFIKWLWMINGFALSLLWPTLIRLLSESLPKKALGKSSVVMGTTVALGTLIIYGLSALYAVFDQFKLAFHTAAFADGVVAILWISLYDKAVNSAKSQRNEEDFFVSPEESKTDAEADTTGAKEGINLKALYASIVALCICAIGVNLVKDGLITWVPAILKEEYSLPASLSILLTLFLPIVAVFGTAFALQVHKKVSDYVTHCFVVFAVIGVLVGGIIASMSIKQVVLMLLGLVVVSFLASSLNSLITSIFPMFMRDKINSGLFAGVLNGFCYVGSAISSFGLGYIADCFGWIAVFELFIGFCVFVALIWVVYQIIKRVANKKQ